MRRWADGVACHLDIGTESDMNRWMGIAWLQGYLRSQVNAESRLCSMLNLVLDLAHG